MNFHLLLLLFGVDDNDDRIDRVGIADISEIGDRGDNVPKTTEIEGRYLT